MTYQMKTRLLPVNIREPLMTKTIEIKRLAEITSTTREDINEELSDSHYYVDSSLVIELQEAEDGVPIERLFILENGVMKDPIYDELKGFKIKACESKNCGFGIVVGDGVANYISNGKTEFNITGIRRVNFTDYGVSLCVTDEDGADIWWSFEYL